MLHLASPILNESELAAVGAQGIPATTLSTLMPISEGSINIARNLPMSELTDIEGW